MTRRPARQSNLTDPDSALMRRCDAHEYRQAYVVPTARGVDAQAAAALEARGIKPLRQAARACCVHMRSRIML
jgi:hypothetical protein